MSHLDMVEFQIQNNAYLKPSFRIWKNGASYETYQINGDGTITSTDGVPNGFQIPPFQSFIIDTKQTFAAPLVFSPAMSITQPGSTLRSSGETRLAPDVLRVEILREGIRQSGLASRYKEGASRHYEKDKDVWTAMPLSITTYVSLYSLVEGGAASIYTTGDITTPIDLDISVGSAIQKAVTT